MDLSKRPEIDKKILYGVLMVAVVFTIIGAFLFSWTSKKTKENVRRQFNAQQLVIANNIAQTLHRKLALIKKEVLLVKKDISGASPDIATVDISIEKAFSRMVENGVRKIEIIDMESHLSNVYTPNPIRVETTVRLDFPDYFFYPQPAGNKIHIHHSTDKNASNRLLLIVSLNGSHRRLLIFHINMNWFLTPVLKNIRSGKTGYAWIIDGDGTFLYHPDTNFIGKNAFFVRKEKNPIFSFHHINFIQKEKMLKGESGASWYYSTWHRGITGKIEKLIAYSPIVISDTPVKKWSVAVVAPVSEIEDVIQKGYTRQFILLGLVILIIGVSAFSVIILEKRWSQRLEKAVDQRTKAYKRSEEKYRALVESAEDFIFSVDNEGRFLSMNNFTAKFFGCDAQAFVGMHLADLFDENIAKRQVELIGLVSRFGKSVRDEFEIKLGEHTIWISANFMPLKDKNGALNAILCIARDITENKDLERQLVNTEKLASIGTLAAGVAHEVNNPLGVMLGFCDLLIQKADETTQTYQDLKIIERQGLHCKRVVENLLSFSRLKKGSSDYADVNVCLSEVISVVRHTLKMNKVELKTVLDDNLPFARGDFRQLQQVFMNLINNAVAAMANGGVLHIATAFQKSGRKVVIRFTDNGTGISYDHMDNIFEPFFTTKPEGEGTGLGLFVSYGIITQYGGTLECKSQPALTDGKVKKPGKTTFTIKLPVK